MKRIIFLVFLAVATSADVPRTKLKTYMVASPPYNIDCNILHCPPMNVRDTPYCLEYDTTEVIEVYGDCLVKKAICFSKKDAPAKDWNDVGERGGKPKLSKYNDVGERGGKPKLISVQQILTSVSSKATTIEKMKFLVLLVILAVAATADKPRKKLNNYIRYYRNPFGLDCDFVMCLPQVADSKHCLEYDTTDVVEDWNDVGERGSKLKLISVQPILTSVSSKAATIEKMKFLVLLVMLAVAATADKPRKKLNNYIRHYRNPFGIDCDFGMCLPQATVWLLPQVADSKHCLEYDTTDVVEVIGYCLVEKAKCWGPANAPPKVVPMTLCDEAIPEDSWMYDN
ncbi:hypothetical protein QE152_g25775 [Popillia japonica]|uniref:Uncharacterized protein n=1 Tax=Popillia japonica TaxID=7064 RepID=A0AAW1K1R1_POPJA